MGVKLVICENRPEVSAFPVTGDGNRRHIPVEDAFKKIGNLYYRVPQVVKGCRVRWLPAASEPARGLDVSAGGPSLSRPHGTTCLMFFNNTKRMS